MKRKTIGIWIAILLCGILLPGGCGEPAAENSGADGKTVIAVSIAPEKAFVEAVCGDTVDVITLIPSGASPENYEPTPQIQADFAKAQVYFSIQVPTEADNILPYAADTTQIVDLAEAAAASYADIDLGGERDPHIWLSPKRVKDMAQCICKTVSELLPENAQLYQKNTKAFLTQLDQLDTAIADALSGVENRKFVVFHPAFGYLAADYELEMFALEEEGKEATPAHLQEMIDLAKEEDIKVIFYQAESDGHQAEAYAEEIGGKTVMLDPLSEDYLDNMLIMAETMAEVMK